MSIRRDLRREDAEVRQEDRRNRTPKQQLKSLDDRLGKGVGAKRNELDY